MYWSQSYPTRYGHRFIRRLRTQAQAPLQSPMRSFDQSAGRPSRTIPHATKNFFSQNIPLNKTKLFLTVNFSIMVSSFCIIIMISSGLHSAMIIKTVHSTVKTTSILALRTLRGAYKTFDGNMQMSISSTETSRAASSCAKSKIWHSILSAIYSLNPSPLDSNLTVSSPRPLVTSTALWRLSAA